MFPQTSLEPPQPPSNIPDHGVRPSLRMRSPVDAESSYRDPDAAQRSTHFEADEMLRRDAASSSRQDDDENARGPSERARESAEAEAHGEAVRQKGRQAAETAQQKLQAEAARRREADVAAQRQTAPQQQPEATSAMAAAGKTPSELRPATPTLALRTISPSMQARPSIVRESRSTTSSMAEIKVAKSEIGSNGAVSKPPTEAWHATASAREFLERPSPRARVSKATTGEPSRPAVAATQSLDRPTADEPMRWERHSHHHNINVIMTSML